jgi:hypothetical protein
VNIFDTFTGIYSSISVLLSISPLACISPQSPISRLLFKFTKPTWLAAVELSNIYVVLIYLYMVPQAMVLVIMELPSVPSFLVRIHSNPLSLLVMKLS